MKKLAFLLTLTLFAQAPAADYWLRVNADGEILCAIGTSTKPGETPPGTEWVFVQEDAVDRTTQLYDRESGLLVLKSPEAVRASVAAAELKRLRSEVLQATQQVEVEKAVGNSSELAVAVNRLNALRARCSELKAVAEQPLATRHRGITAERRQMARREKADLRVRFRRRLDEELARSIPPTPPTSR